jgi:hypothetical protein
VSNLQLDLVRVRKGKGVVHLTVRAEAGHPVETLCERTFQPGEYQVTDSEASCAACLRRSEDPARLSNAMFGQDLGSKLLELSLSQTRKRPAEEPAAEKPAKPSTPRLTIVSTSPEADRREPARVDETPPQKPPEVIETGPRQAAGLDLSRFEKLGRDRYRTPGGVNIRIALREGGGWDIADLEFGGEARVEQLADGRVRLRLGDLRVEYSGDFERRWRFS